MRSLCSYSELGFMAMDKLVDGIGLASIKTRHQHFTSPNQARLLSPHVVFFETCHKTRVNFRSYCHRIRVNFLKYCHRIRVNLKAPRKPQCSKLFFLRFALFQFCTKKSVAKNLRQIFWYIYVRHQKHFIRTFGEN